jgi:hypothetical protein
LNEQHHLDVTWVCKELEWIKRTLKRISFLYVTETLVT